MALGVYWWPPAHGMMCASHPEGLAVCCSWQRPRGIRAMAGGGGGVDPSREDTAWPPLELAVMQGLGQLAMLLQAKEATELDVPRIRVMVERAHWDPLAINPDTGEMPYQVARRLGRENVARYSGGAGRGGGGEGADSRRSPAGPGGGGGGGAAAVAGDRGGGG